MDQAILQVVYVSQAAKTLGEDDLRAIQEQSVRNNARCGVTGLLLYRSGMFMQLLEGPESAVRATLDRINGDRRHTGLEVLVWRQAATRYAPMWFMGVLDSSTRHTSEDWIDQVIDLAAHCHAHDFAPGYQADLQSLFVAFSGDEHLNAA